VRQRQPPRLVVRTSVATFSVVALLLSGVLVLIALQGRSYVRSTVIEKLDAGQRMLSALEQRQARELQSQVAVLAENSTLKAAVDIYHSEFSSLNGSRRAELLSTIQRELQKVADRIQPDVLAVSDNAGTVLATAGRRRADWPESIPTASRRNQEQLITLPSGVFRRVTAPLALQDVELGVLAVATALDDEYARKLSALSGASTLVAAEGRVIATTLPASAASALTANVLQSLPASTSVRLDETEYAVTQVFQSGATSVFALDSIDAAVAPVLNKAMSPILWLSAAAFGIAGLASLWMARTLSRPIDRLSRSLAEMTQSRSFDADLPATGSSLEVDALTRTFNTMMRTVSAAEEETRSAYVGAIRALALALDARDPYTAGHSERVSALSVAVGRQLGLSAEDLDVLRLGALLHDIGKIGISDNVLRKPDGLTPDEFEVIKQHPSLGARILRTVPFLARHVPIVELHHERPDGRGYPFGFSSEQTPLLARIVHVADAFDAITSARAYRPARESDEAIRELWRHAGTQFDAEVVQALVQALPGITSSGVTQPAVDLAAQAAARRLTLVPRS
jgi:putative nucleotidyltransferase with HDIG domain